jgi:hypothetical protein
MIKITGLFISFAISSIAAPQVPKRDSVYNIIVLLDLSDRILAKDQIYRDKQILHAIYTTFEKKIQKSFYFKSKDAFTVQIAYQKGFPLPVEDIENGFYFNMNEKSLVEKSRDTLVRRRQFETNLDSLYSKAVFSNKKSDYRGADIQRYFNDDLSNDIKQGDSVKNFLIILTDGYMYIEGKIAESAESFIPVNKRFPGLHVILMEADPKPKDGENDRLHVVWQEWLRHMEITDFIFVKKDQLQKNIQSLKNFFGFQ